MSLRNIQADGWGKANTYAKKQKNRHERRKAKINAGCQPTYGKYKGWVS